MNQLKYLPRSHDGEEKGWGSGSGSKKALNYGKQGRQIADKNVAGEHYKALATKPLSANPLTWLQQTAASSVGSSLALLKLHSATFKLVANR